MAERRNSVKDDRRARFEGLAALVYEPLQRYTYRRTDRHTAEDVVADVMLIVWRRLDDVPKGGELAWSYAVARRQLANAFRARQRRSRLARRLASEPEPAMTGDGPLDAEIHEALAALGERDAEVLTLWAWESLQPREIGAVLGISANAAAVRLHKAQRRLGEILIRNDPPPTGHIGNRHRKEKTA